MAMNSYGVFLMQEKAGSSGQFEKLVDIKDFPDIGGTPEMLQTTTLSNRGHTYIPGIDNNDNMEFAVNYTLEDYKKLKALKGKKTKFAIWMGGSESENTITPTGSEGKWDFDGYLSVTVKGAGVNEVVEMTVSIAPASDINDHSNDG